MLFGGISDQQVPPLITAFYPVDIPVGTLADNDILDTRSAFQCLIGDVLQRNVLVPSAETIIGDQHLGVTVLHALGKRLCREPCKDDGVYSTDSGTSQSSNDQFRSHGHVNTDAVTLLNSLACQYVGKPADIFVQLTIGDRKSTRLNSSHVAISYYVFFLKH